MALPALSSSPRTGVFLALLLAIGMAATVGGALAFQHIGGYIPCALCLVQRDPYYWGVPVALLAAASAALRLPAWLTRLFFVIIGLMMLGGAGLGAYHSGVEWGFWEGPASCATSAVTTTTSAGNLLSDINSIRPPSCSEASLRILGLSFAGWNVLASLFFAAIAFTGVRKAA